MQGVLVEEVLLFELEDRRFICDLRSYIGELWRRRKQLMSSVCFGGGGFLEGTR